MRAPPRPVALAEPSPAPVESFERVVGDGQIALIALAAITGAWWASPPALPHLHALSLASTAVGLLARRAVILAIAVLLLTASFGQRALAGLDPASRGPVSGRAVLVTDPERLVAGTRAIARLDGQRVELWAHGGPAGSLGRALAGDVVVLSGERSPLRPEEIRGLAWRRLVGTVEINRVDAVEPGAWPYRLANTIHRRLDRGAGSLPDGDRSLLAGLVLGDDRAQPALLRDAFDAVGLSHLLAVSGQNVAFVLAAAGPLLRRLRLRARWCTVIGLLGFFAVVTRFEPSVLRAVTMAMLATTATTLGRPASGMRVLCLATTGLLVVDPLLVRSLGFQLSVLASAGIILLAPALAGRLPLPGWLATAVAVPLAAQLATSPLLVARNGALPVVSILANVLVEPAAGAVMTWGSSAGLVAGFLPGPLAAAVHLPTRVLLRWISGVAVGCARLPPLPITARPLALALLAAAVVFAVGRRAGPHAAAGDVTASDGARPEARPVGAERPAALVPAVLAGVAIVVWLADPGGLRRTPLPGGVELHRAGAAEVVVIGRPVDGARLLRALRGRIEGGVELLVVSSPSSGAWQSAGDLRARYRVDTVLSAVARPDGAAVDAPVDLAVGSMVVSVRPRAGSDERLDVAVAGADPPGPAP